jgi:hypothetical protein
MVFFVATSIDAKVSTTTGNIICIGWFKGKIKYIDQPTGAIGQGSRRAHGRRTWIPYD